MPSKPETGKQLIKDVFSVCCHMHTKKHKSKHFPTMLVKLQIDTTNIRFIATFEVATATVKKCLNQIAYTLW